MLKFQSPTPTKSGEPVIKIWNVLKENWRIYKQAKLEDDYIKMQVTAKKIREFQIDLGIKQTEFLELKKETNIQ